METYWDVKIFDKRESKIVQKFEGINESTIFNKLFLLFISYSLHWINCVRWSPMAICSQVLQVIRQLHYLTSKLGKKFILARLQMRVIFSCLMNNNNSRLIIGLGYVHLFPLSKDQFNQKEVTRNH